MSVPERERRNLVVGKQILRLRHFGENLRNPDVYKYLASCQLFFSKDDFLKRVSHVPQQMLDRRNQVRDEDIGNFDRFTHTVTSLWESQDAVKQSQAEYILRNLYRVMEARSAGNPFERELKEDREFSNKILYDNDSISNLADALMARETEEGETFEVTPVTVFGPVTGNRITFGKKAMSAEFALPMTPADHVTNPLEKTDFAASYMNLRTKYIQLEKDYAKHRKEDTSKIEVEFADNSLPSRLAAEAAAIQPKEPRELAIACARGLCISPETEQVNTIESNILEFASSGLRPEAIRRLSIPLDGESIPAIEITETEADLGEYKKRRERGELIQSVPREDYVYSNGEMLFKATGKYLLYFKDGKLNFSYDYETAKPQDMVSRMRTGMEYFNRTVNKLYEYFQLEPRTVILPLDRYREKALVDFEIWDHKSIEERVEHLGGYKESTLSRIEKFRDDVVAHFDNPDNGKPQNILLTGPTGVGKTTVTRALAKAFGEKGIPVYKLSDREPINIDTLTRTVRSFIRNRDGGVLIIEDLVDYFRNASPEQFQQAQASLIQTLKTLADHPKHVVIYNSEKLDELAENRWAMVQPHRTDTIFLDPDISGNGIESLLRAAMARSLSTEEHVVMRDLEITTEQLNKISGGKIDQFIQGVRQIDQDYPGVGLTPNIVGTTSRTTKQAGRLDWKSAGMEEILAAIRDNMENKSRLNPDSPLEQARLAAGEYQTLVTFLQEIQKAGGLDAWKASITGTLIQKIEQLEEKVAALIK